MRTPIVSMYLLYFANPERVAVLLVEGDHVLVERLATLGIQVARQCLRRTVGTGPRLPSIFTAGKRKTETASSNLRSNPPPSSSVTRSLVPQAKGEGGCFPCGPLPPCCPRPSGCGRMGEGSRPWTRKRRGCLAPRSPLPHARSATSERSPPLCCQPLRAALPQHWRAIADHLDRS